ncbi:SatD family protein [Microbacterium betulae]|uniref:SatD family protein n=1 Tax=Microbacterium betulae TaxID=2981139 RepID=A0AA97I4C5_9MICO|nr:SatD family protein [Microbacterium sp. AB]WOF21614.1 SatD family protein [Microbacterium sp. AB]
MPVAVIADIVSSRASTSRDDVQREIETSAVEVDRTYPRAVLPWYPTVGDEFQATFRTIEDALVSTLYLQLALPENVGCRFGLGVGGVVTVASQLADRIQDGPGWWAARAAVEHAHALEDGKLHGARSWLVVDEDASAHERGMAGVVNAYLLARDQSIADMGPRARRAAFDLWRGLPQKEIAASEGISPSAVSQALGKPIVRVLRLGAEEIGRSARARVGTDEIERVISARP